MPNSNKNDKNSVKDIRNLGF